MQRSKREKKIMHGRAKNMKMNKWIDNSETELRRGKGKLWLLSDMMQKLIINGIRRAKLFIA